MLKTYNLNQKMYIIAYLVHFPPTRSTKILQIFARKNLFQIGMNHIQRRPMKRLLQRLTLSWCNQITSYTQTIYPVHLAYISKSCSPLLLKTIVFLAIHVQSPSLQCSGAFTGGLQTAGTILCPRSTASPGSTEKISGKASIEGLGLDKSQASFEGFSCLNSGWLFYAS